MEDESEVVTEENPDKSAEVVIAFTALSTTETARDLALKPVVTTAEEIKRPSIPEPGAPVVITEEATGDGEVKEKAVPRGTLRAEMG